jgi:predicted AlkP superfamily phosphohydrolase/phosphomutase
MGVLILGLDGMTWEVLDRLGPALPVFRRLRQQGAWGPLTSTVPAVTPTAWPSMLTGKNPGQHGVWGFRRPAPDPEPWRFSVVTGFDYEAMPLWRILERCGRRGAFFNVPCAFPLDEQFTAGVLTAGFMAPSVERAFAYPAAFQRWLLDRHPAFQFKLSGIMDGPRTLARAAEIVAMKFDVIRQLRRREAWDVLFAVVDETDTVQHRLWAEIVRGEPAAVAFYVALDREVGRLLEDVERAGDTLLIVSDHGFRGVSSLFCVNEALERLGYLRFRQSRWKPAARSLAVDLLRRVPPARAAMERYRQASPGERIRAGRPMRLSGLYERIDAVGVQAGTEVDIRVARPDPDLVERVHRDLSSLVAPYPDVRVARGAELYHGPHAEDMPPLVVLSQGRTALSTRRHGVLTRSLPLVGEHRPDGVVLGIGPGIAPGEGTPMHVCDVLPTVLCLLGLPVPNDLDGRPAGYLLREGQRWRAWDARSGAVYDPDAAPSPLVRERLRGLAGRPDPGRQPGTAPGPGRPEARRTS